MYAHEVIVNELAQGLRPTAEGIEWFESLPEDDRRRVLRSLALFCAQARARQDDVPESITRSGIRPTHTPAVMLTKWRFGMDSLPAHELTGSFRLLVALLTIADTRRRALYCAAGCTHEWHDLGRRGGNGTRTATALPFYGEVRVRQAAGLPGLKGRLGGILGITEPGDEATPPAYAVLLDGDEEVHTFRHDEIEPTGRMRRREDYY
ncbi:MULTISPECIES: DUF5958 family protein [unclassified Streptomyces]|uniref:DUF5958 family protein n=1 Tax=unclassified Streptomyces TaxID=2593676 RepID=UPI00214BF3EF|nr:MULTISPECIES: DUF5958 family protein [unclassified Streptomyces]